jgi:hypothetical protein
MAYINFQEDPIAKRFNNSFAALCSSDPTKKILRLVDKCFTIFNKSKSETSFCSFENIYYPVDGSQSIDFEVCSEDSLTLFDNNLSTIPVTFVDLASQPINYPIDGYSEYFNVESTSPGGDPGYYILPNDTSYARGLLLYVEYPKVDKDGADIPPAQMSCNIILTDYPGSSLTLPISQAFSHFSNPETRNATKLINKIEIHNPNLTFSVKVRGLVIYVKSNSNPIDCAC